MKKSLILLALVVGLFLIQVVSAVRINEVMYNPNISVGGTYNEWIEVYSTDVTNITLKEKSGSSNKTFNLNIDRGYNIIVRDKTKFLNIWNLSMNITEFGMELNNGGDEIWIYGNESLLSYLNYISSMGANGNGKSLQFCNNSWIESSPTPGSENNCSAQTCIQNWSCSAWGSCTNEIQKRTCTDLNNCSNVTGKPAESKTCNQNTSEISLEMNWDEEDIVNGQEFEIEIKAYNLESEDYDVRVWIEFEDNDTIISDRYGTDDSGEEKWMSGRYYIYGLFDGPGNKTEKVDLRIRGEYEDFEGSAKIFSRVRDIDEISSSIEILEKKEENKEDNSPQPEEAIGKTVGSYEGNSSFTGSVIHLGGLKEKEESGIDEAKTNTSIIYESKNELIKKYSLFGFALLCTALSILLVLNKLN